MARKSRKNTPIAVAEPTDNLTTLMTFRLDDGIISSNSEKTKL